MLPKMKHPLVEITVPSLKKKLPFRPFTVEEEKIMLMAASSENDSPVFATKQVLNNCCASELDVDKLASFDLEWLFIQLRAISVSNILELSIKDETIQVDLKNVKIQYPESTNNRIMLSEADKIGVVLKYPTYSDLEQFSDSKDNSLAKTIIEQVFQGEQVFDAKDYTEEEIQTFLNSLSIPQMAKIENWINNIPYVYLDVLLKDGTTTRLRGINDFFGF